MLGVIYKGKDVSKDTEVRTQRACLGPSRKVCQVERKGEPTGRKLRPNITEGPLDMIYVLGVLSIHFVYYPLHKPGRLHLRPWFSAEHLPLPLCDSAGTCLPRGPRVVHAPSHLVGVKCLCVQLPG